MVVPSQPPSSTAHPTTPEPTTSQPSSQHSSAQPLTAQPTTAEPTTDHPSTAHPTTLQPSTAHPPTADLPTAQPTSPAHTTAAPPSSAPAIAVALVPRNASLSAAALCRAAVNASTGNTTAAAAAPTPAPAGLQIELDLSSGTGLAPGANASACFVVRSSLHAGDALGERLALVAASARVAGSLVSFELPLVAVPFESSGFTLLVSAASAACFARTDGGPGNVTLGPAAALNFSAAVCAAPPPHAAVTTAQTAGRVGQIAVIAAVNPAMAAQAMRAGLSLALIVCIVRPEPLSAMQSPLRLSLGSSPARYNAGAAVGNVLLLLALVALQLGIAAALRARRAQPWDEVLATVRFPSLLVFPLMLLQQSTVAAAVTAVMVAEKPLAAIGVVVVVLMASVVPLTYAFVLRKRVFACTYSEVKIETGMLRLFFFGRGRWKDTAADAANAEGTAADSSAGSLGSVLQSQRFFKQRFQFFFADNLPKGRAFMLGEMTMNVLCGVCQGMISPAYCKSLLFASVVVFGGYAAAGLYIRPFVSLCYGIFAVGQAVLQLISCALSIVAVATGSERMLDVAAYSNALCMYMLLLQAFVGLWPKAKQVQAWIARLRGMAGHAAADVEVVQVTSMSLAALSAQMDVPMQPVGFDGGPLMAAPPANVSPVPTEAAATTEVNLSPVAVTLGDGDASDRRSKVDEDENTAVVAAPLPHIASGASIDLSSTPSHDSLDDLLATVPDAAPALPVVEAEPVVRMRESEMADLEYSPLVSMRLASSYGPRRRQKPKPRPDADRASSASDDGPKSGDDAPPDVDFEL